MPAGKHSKISVLARVSPADAIERVLDAYARAGGYPDGAARILGYRTRRGRDALHRLNRRLGIVAIVQRRTGHKPGWMGRPMGPEGTRIYEGVRRPHRRTHAVD
jgi:hypothetical protein